MVKTNSIKLKTRGNADAHDISVGIAQAVTTSQMKNGTVAVFCPSSTSAVTTIEFESGCVADLQHLFDEIVTPNRNYAHNARRGRVTKDIISGLDKPIAAFLVFLV